MKKYRYAIMDENKRAHVLTVNEGENLAPIINRFNLVIVHPCSSYAEAVKIVEAWKAAQQ
jgi:dihydropteroate synthase